MKLNIDLLQIKRVYLKQVSIAMGGTITVSDTPDGIDHYRMKIDYKIVRRFIKAQHNRTKFSVPIPCDVLVYDDFPITFQMMDISEEYYEGVFKTTSWMSHLRHNVEHVKNVVKADTVYDWYINGVDIYRKLYRHNEPIDSKRVFDLVSYDTFDVALLNIRATPQLMREESLTFLPGDIDLPPFLPSMDMGLAKYGTGDSIFDSMEENYTVHLAALLYLAEWTTKMFGAQEIELFDLPEYMIRLQTVNLPALPRETKQRCPTGFTPIASFAILARCVKKSTTIDHSFIIRRMLKYVVNKGMIHNDRLTVSALFKPGHNVNTIPHHSYRPRE